MVIFYSIREEFLIASSSRNKSPVYGNVIRSKDFMITGDQPCHPREGIPHFMKGFYKIVLLHCFTSSASGDRPILLFPCFSCGLEHTNEFLEKEPVGKLMRMYSVPCIISLLVAALYNIVDQIFIANSFFILLHVCLFIFLCVLTFIRSRSV